MNARPSAAICLPVMRVRSFVDVMLCVVTGDPSPPRISDLESLCLSGRDNESRGRGVRSAADVDDELPSGRVVEDVDLPEPELPEERGGALVERRDRRPQRPALP